MKFKIVRIKTSEFEIEANNREQALKKADDHIIMNQHIEIEHTFKCVKCNNSIAHFKNANLCNNCKPS